MRSLATVLVALSGLWLIGLAVASLATPERARAFLSRFASSARAHYLEQALRLLAGIGFVLAAPGMRRPEIFGWFGWILIGSAVALLLVPWRWHHRFAGWAVPSALRHLNLLALSAAALGVAILWGLT